jgi:CheY-like chemotaxis protein
MCKVARRMGVRPVVVVASPDAAEVAMLSEWLRAEGLEPVQVRSLPAAIHQVQSRPFDVLIADARFAFDAELQVLARMHNARAPLVVIGDAAARAERHGAFHLARPVDQTLLLCHVAMAIAEGRPARRSERKCIAPFDALVEGTRAYVVDVSTEGLRLKLPRGRSAPPPHFAVRIPLVGVGVTVRRVWMTNSPADPTGGVWCGVELYQVHPTFERSWRAFVSTVSGR